MRQRHGGTCNPVTNKPESAPERNGTPRQQPRRRQPRAAQTPPPHSGRFYASRTQPDTSKQTKRGARSPPTRKASTTPAAPHSQAAPPRKPQGELAVYFLVTSQLESAQGRGRRPQATPRRHGPRTTQNEPPPGDPFNENQPPPSTSTPPKTRGRPPHPGDELPSRSRVTVWLPYCMDFCFLG